MPECWSCGSSLKTSYNYCPECAVPVTEFEVEQSEGFLSHSSIRYARATVLDEWGYPKDEEMDTELQNSLNKQLLEDVRAGLVGFAVVCRIDDLLIFRAIKDDLADMFDESISEDEWLDDMSPEVSGFARLILTFGKYFPPEAFERIHETTPSQEDT